MNMNMPHPAQLQATSALQVKLVYINVHYLSVTGVMCIMALADFINLKAGVVIVTACLKINIVLNYRCKMLLQAFLTEPSSRRSLLSVEFSKGLANW